MKSEEELVLKVLRVAIAAAFLMAMGWMIYSG